MQKSFPLLILILVNALLASDYTIRVATWNIRCIDKNDSLQGDAWSKRAPEIAKSILFRQFEIVGVQEDSKIHREMLIELLPDYKAILGDSLRENTIFYKADRFEALEEGAFGYSPDLAIGKRAWDTKHPRLCRWAKFLDKRSGHEFFVFNAHWDNQGDTARIESAKLTRAQIQKIAGDSPAVFMGDLNIKPERKALKILMKDSFLQNAKTSAKIVSEPEGSFTKYRTMRKSENTLDHIFFRGSLNILHFGILRETYYDGETFRFPSDHHPVMIDMEIFPDKKSLSTEKNILSTENDAPKENPLNKNADFY